MEVFEKHILPNSWEWSVFADWLDIQGGSQPPKKFFSDTQKDGYIRLYQIRDLGEKPIPVYVDKKKVSKFCTTGDILIGRYGASVGKIFWAKDGAYNVALVKLLFQKKVFDKSYLFYFLKSQYFQRYLNLISKTAQDGFNKTDLSQIPVPLAPLNEQKRIVSKIEELFSDLDEGEAALKKVQKLLTRYRRSVLKAAVTGELTKDWREANKHRLESGEALLQRILQTRREQWQGKGKYQEPATPGTSNLPELPEGWTLATIEQLASAVEYGTSAKCDQDVNGVAVLRMGNIFEGQLLLDDLKYLSADHDEFPQLLLEPGDLLFNRTNSAELVGKTAVYHGKPDKCSYASYLIRVRFIETEPEFLSAFINSAYGRSWIRNVVSQQVGQANVNGTKLKNLTVPLPPKQEQEEIAQKLGDIFSRIDTLKNWCQTELARSSTLRQSILKDAFSGKLVPQDPADEPASELSKRIQAEWERQPVEKTQRSRRKEQPTLWESA